MVNMQCTTFLQCPTITPTRTERQLVGAVRSKSPAKISVTVFKTFVLPYRTA